MLITKPITRVISTVDTVFSNGLTNPVPQYAAVGRHQVELNTVNIAFYAQVGIRPAGTNVRIPGDGFETGFFTAGENLPVHRWMDPFDPERHGRTGRGQC